MEGISIHSKVFRSLGTNVSPVFWIFRGITPGFSIPKVGTCLILLGFLRGWVREGAAHVLFWGGDMGCLGAIPPYVMVVGGDPGTPIPPLPGGRDPRDPGADRGDSGAD